METNLINNSNDIRFIIASLNNNFQILQQYDGYSLDNETFLFNNFVDFDTFLYYPTPSNITNVFIWVGISFEN